MTMATLMRRMTKLMICWRAAKVKLSPPPGASSPSFFLNDCQSRVDFLIPFLDDVNSFHDRIAQPTWVGSGSGARLLAHQLDMTVSACALLLQGPCERRVVRQD